VPTILLVRHGQASFGAADYDRLSPLGEEQSLITADALAVRGLKIQRIISGTLRRQRGTAAPLAARLGQDAEVDGRWNEYSMDDIIAAHSPAPAQPETTTTGGSALSSAEFQNVLEAALTGWIEAADATTAQESWPAFHARIDTALHELAASLDTGMTALVFTSGGVIATVCAELLDVAAPQLLLLNRVSVNTGVTKIVAGRRNLSLISFNDHSHLERDSAGLITYR
jgi:broad specificity phosphatase PhoE